MITMDGEWLSGKNTNHTFYLKSMITMDGEWLSGKNTNHTFYFLIFTFYFFSA